MSFLSEEVSNASPDYSTTTSGHKPNFEAVVIAEPDAIALADAIVDTHASAIVTDTEIDDDEVEEISDDDEPPSVENNGALTEEEQIEPVLSNSIQTAIPSESAEIEEKSPEDESKHLIYKKTGIRVI